MKKGNALLRLMILPLVGSMMYSCSETVPGTNSQILSLEDGILVYAPDVAMPVDGGNQDMTRGSYYDGNKGGVYFDWVAYDSETGIGDIVGVVPTTGEQAQQMRFECRTVSTTSDYAQDGVSKAVFKQEDATFALQTNQDYYVYYPYTSEAMDVTAIPMDYTGQQQTGKPDMVDYFKADGNKANYYATEKTASKHLSEKSFMLSDLTRVSNNVLPFKMRRLCGIVRFYLALPKDLDVSVSEVRLVATKAVFHEHATLNVLTGAITPTGEATNNIKLDITGVTLSGSNTYAHYLVAYMMAHPVKLTNVLDSSDKIYIYVRGKNTSNNEDVYFRSAENAKKDIEAGKLTQFAIKATKIEEPIDVQSITVQEWQDGLTMDNNDGKGTGNW